MRLDHKFVPREFQTNIFCCIFGWCIVLKLLVSVLRVALSIRFTEHSIELAAFIKSQIYHAALHCNCQRKERALGK